MAKKSFEIRLRKTVEIGSWEEILLSFLDDKSALPYSKVEMLMIAAMICWLPLGCQYKKQSSSDIRQALYDAQYRWENHYQYLQHRVGVKVPNVISMRAQQVEQEQEIEQPELELDESPEPFNPFGSTILS